MNRSLSIRSRKKDQKEAPSHTFSFGTLRGISKAELAKKLYKLIKTENYVIDAYENAGRERLSIASQLSDWGESTNDDALSDISDKLGVILSEIGEQEDLFAQNLEDYRTILKQIRNTEQSVQPSRDHKAKISDEIQKLKYKEPTSPKLPTLEQELTRQKIKEAYDLHFAATIERAEKQIILAKYGRRLLNLLDDTPVVPGDSRPQFTGGADARQVLADAEHDLQHWQPNLEPIHTNASGLGANLMPSDDATTTASEVEQRELAQHIANAAESPSSQHKHEDQQGKHLEGAHYGHEIFKRVGHDTFLTVAPGGICLHSCEPAVVTQITTRRNDFPKPTSMYASLDVYGKNVNDEDSIGEGHSMTYTYAIHCLLDNILLHILLPKWLLKRVPFKLAKKADEAYREWGNYMKEMVGRKRQDIQQRLDSDQMDIIGQLVKGQMAEKGTEGGSPLTDAEILGNMFVLILAGHETAANSIHFIMLYMALYPRTQRLLQKDLDNIFQGKPPAEWSYHRDLPALFGGMAGAVLNEELRLVPPAISIPKSTWGVSDQSLMVEGRSCTVPGGTYISLVAPGAHRNAKYWPTGLPTYPGGKTAHPCANLDNDLEEFKPERWLLEEGNKKNDPTRPGTGDHMPSESIEGGDLGVNESADTSERLYKPAKGVYFPFSDGYRSCLGRRFAQVEVLAAVAVIFQNYSAELAVDKYASDEEVIKMDMNGRADVWQKAAEDARELLLSGLGVIITLQMRAGHVKLRFRPRGQERFPENVDDIWKKNHPDLCSTTGVPAWRWWKGLKVHQTTPRS
ncbi:hypothetical protein DV737_g4740, partial [Chaetothyriales sp. CBS 132003]